MQHAQLESMLGAFADGELDPAEHRLVADHLRGCEQCRQGLEVQRRVAARLAAHPVEPAPEAFRTRIVNDIQSWGRARPRRWWHAATLGKRIAVANPWLGWAAAATVAAVWVISPPGAGPFGQGVQSGRTAAAPAPGAQPRIPMVEEALADYRSLGRRELPVQVEDPRELGSLVPFGVTPLASRELTVIGAWTTVIRGEVAAAVAYRWENRVVVQYVVSERLFFRQPAVREAVARAGFFQTAEGAQGVIAWPQAGSGSIVVADVPALQLQRLMS